MSEPSPWRTLRHGPLRLRLPAAVAPEQEGTDSPVAAWTGEGLRVVVDSGPMSDPVTGYGGRPEAEQWTREAHDCTVRAVSFRNPDGTHTVAARVQPRAGLGAGPMTVVVHLQAAEQLAVAHRIVESISVIAEGVVPEPVRPAVRNPP